MAHMVKKESYRIQKYNYMNTDVLITLLENDILEPIMRSMFQSINIKLANAEHRMNILNLHQQKKMMN
jgi:hypothetical protein